MSMNPETIKKIWSVVKTIIEVIIAAFAGAATAHTASAMGLLQMFN